MAPKTWEKCSIPAGLEFLKERFELKQKNSKTAGGKKIVCWTPSPLESRVCPAPENRHSLDKSVWKQGKACSSCCLSQHSKIDIVMFSS